MKQLHYAFWLVVLLEVTNLDKHKEGKLSFPLPLPHHYPEMAYKTIQSFLHSATHGSQWIAKWTIY